MTPPTPVPPTPTTTGLALTGLLSLRSWTAYELTRQMRRALRWAWPRSEANLYSEIKRLAAQGLAVAVEESAAGRSRTRYEVTDHGRAAVADWLRDHPPSPPHVQFEAMLRVFLADQGSMTELRRTIAATRSQMLDLAEDALPILEDYAADDVPFPDRAHLNLVFIHFYAGFVALVLRWCDETETEMESWAGRTAGVGVTPGTRRMLDDALDFYRATLAAHRPTGTRG